MKSTCWFYIKIAGDTPQNTRAKSPAPGPRPLMTALQYSWKLEQQRTIHSLITGKVWIGNLTEGHVPPRGVCRRTIKSVFRVKLKQMNCRLQCNLQKRFFFVSLLCQTVKYLRLPMARTEMNRNLSGLLSLQKTLHVFSVMFLGRLCTTKKRN